MNVENMTNEEIIQKLEKQFGKILTYISPAPDIPNKYGGKVFRCLDLDGDAILTVDPEGYVVSRLLNSKYTDVIGQIKL